MSKILYVDMDNVLVDFPTAFPQIPPETLLAYEGRLDEVPGIFSLMNPVAGAVESFHELSGLFDKYVLSTSPWENPSAWSDKLLWIKRYLGRSAYKRLILKLQITRFLPPFLDSPRHRFSAFTKAQGHSSTSRTSWRDSHSLTPARAAPRARSCRSRAAVPGLVRAAFGPRVPNAAGCPD